ncbi:MAG: ribonuclease PH [Anaerolineae bacterium]|nr:ribonuclease PH [Anaerolineae bacterium]
MRPDGRESAQLRPLTFELSPVRHPQGSALIRMGETCVLCTAIVQESVPRWRQNSGKGWITAEYAMLPGATQTRVSRDHVSGGRAQEIRRLIGRSLRRAVNLDLLGERAIWVDCDVLQADGGTRTAAINGGYIAVALAIQHLANAGLISMETLLPPIAALSVGVVADEACMDLCFQEDSSAQVDMNVVMDAVGGFIEVQGTAEKDPISRATLDTLLDLAAAGVQTVARIQREALSCAGITI